MSYGGISVNKEGLSSALSTFGEISSSLSTEIQKIKDNLAIIEQNWSGTEHDNAATDRALAEADLSKALDNITNMNTAIGKLSANANKIQYNG